MAFHLVQEGTVLRVVYSDVVTVDERTRALATAFAASTKNNRRILVDFRAAFATPPATDFEATKRFVDMLSRETSGGRSRVAYLTEHDMPIDRCMEMLIESRRIPARRFIDEAEALAWLVDSAGKTSAATAR